MKSLLSCSHQAEVKYPGRVLLDIPFSGVLYCVFDKSMIGDEPVKKVTYPTSFYLYLEDFDIVYNSTSDPEHKFWNLQLKDARHVNKIKHIIELQNEVKFDGSEVDSDTLLQNSHLVFPPNSLIKSVSVSVYFMGLDAKGNAVWKILL